MSFLASRQFPAKDPLRAFVSSVTSSAFLTASTLAFLAFITSPGLPAGDKTDVILTIFFFAFVVSLVTIAIAGLVVGLPLTWILSNNRLEQPWTYPLAGLVAGGVIALLMVVVVEGPHVDVLAEYLPFALVGAFPGCIYGTLWWHFHRRHMQDA